MIEDLANVDDAPARVAKPMRTRPTRLLSLLAVITGVYGVGGLAVAVGGYVEIAMKLLESRRDPTLSRGLLIDSAATFGIVTLYGIAGGLMLRSAPLWLRGDWRRAFTSDVAAILSILPALYMMSIPSR